MLRTGAKAKSIPKTLEMHRKRPFEYLSKENNYNM